MPATTATGSTVSILDGGTDFGHPDLIGTWLTAPVDGWPQAYDPFDTLILAASTRARSTRA